ncbi:trans-aconitate 2-methyltransferase [Euzebya sp.]|uniref:trans-aconitate 2-methyltransferase n=1 Tax=Euzebya sp. TaxID=1971409 RepID=UPI0035154BA5
MWDPTSYLRFTDHRERPFAELLARVGAVSPRRVVDLGCGPGTLTPRLAERWPDAVVEAIDSSPEMVAAARDRGVDAQVVDVADWRPSADVDVVVSNAVLQWVDGHDELLRGWVAALGEGAWLAVQVPSNFHRPSHALVRELAASSRWADALAGVRLRGPDAVLTPEGYADLLADAGARIVDVWQTTYVQPMTGEDPVLEWISGTALRPIRQALDDDAWAAFRGELAPLLRDAYPSRGDGITWFPFDRTFAVARV